MWDINQVKSLLERLPMYINAKIELLGDRHLHYNSDYPEFVQKFDEDLQTFIGGLDK